MAFLAPLLTGLNLLGTLGSLAPPRGGKLKKSDKKKLAKALGIDGSGMYPAGGRGLYKVGSHHGAGAKKTKSKN